MTALWIKPVDQGILFKIVVQPRAAKTEIIGLHGDALKIKLTAPPVDGAANKMVIALLAKCLAIPKSRLEIKTGSTGRHKQILVRLATSNPKTGEIDKIAKRIQGLARV